MPDDCPKFTPRLADVNWSHGTLVTPPTPAEPLDALDRDDGSVAALLDEAEDIVNAIGPGCWPTSQGAARLGPSGTPQAHLPPQALAQRLSAIRSLTADSALGRGLDGPVRR